MESIQKKLKNFETEKWNKKKRINNKLRINRRFVKLLREETAKRVMMICWKPKHVVGKMRKIKRMKSAPMKDPVKLIHPKMTSEVNKRLPSPPPKYPISPTRVPYTQLLYKKFCKTHEKQSLYLKMFYFLLRLN